jgi:parvulin-like peptidyl-prolyl isomerase
VTLLIKQLPREATIVRSKNCKRNTQTRLELLALAGTLLFSAAVLAADGGKTDASPSAKASPEAAAGPEAAKPSAPQAAPKGLPYFAKVGDMYISWIDYNNEYAAEARNKFYHGRPSESMQAKFQRQIGDTLITNAMLVLEAKRRGIKPDEAYVKEQLGEYEQRFSSNPKWPEARSRVLPILTWRAENKSLRAKIEDEVRNVPEPTTAQLKQYYDQHIDKFTVPEQIRVSVLLLKLDPGATNAEWTEARGQAKDLLKRIRAGENFADLARDYSGDKTAEDGGDMGYLHEGMLPGLPAETVRQLKPGETSEPINLMEGVALFKLTERIPSKVNSFEAVQARVKDLWVKEQGDKAWNDLIAKLKKETPVVADESQFLPLPKEDAGESATKDKPDEGSEKTN